MMTAVVSARYGSPDVLEIRQVPKPAPRPDEVLVKVHATTVTRTDCGMLRPHPSFGRIVLGLRRPKITTLGIDFAGEVEAVGPGVASFKPGDRVFGLSPDTFGAHAEYLCVPQHGAIAPMPAGLPFDEAVVCEGAWYADTNLRAFRLEPGDRILVYGASGAIGTAAVQLARICGATVTAVVATRQMDLLRSLGADRVVDYTAEDVTRIGETFDRVLDAVGRTTFFRCRRLLAPNGVFAATDLGPWCQNPLLAIWSSISGSRRVLFPLPRSGQAQDVVHRLKAHLEAGRYRAVIDRKYHLEAIADAYRYVETGQKTGIVAIHVVPPRARTPLGPGGS